VDRKSCISLHIAPLIFSTRSAIAPSSTHGHKIIANCVLGDYYVHYDCTAIRGYEEVKNLVESKGIHTMDQVCNSRRLGAQYNTFPSDSFGTAPDTVRLHSGASYTYEYTRSASYDSRSIMHYSSNSGSPKPGRQVLRKWKRTYSAAEPPPEVADDSNSEVIARNTKPSALDIQAAKELYPW
jgi:hypothetical protein